MLRYLKPQRFRVLQLSLGSEDFLFYLCLFPTDIILILLILISLPVLMNLLALLIHRDLLFFIVL